MKQTITATQVLEMLVKARQLGIQYDVYDAEECGHFIQFEVDWYGDGYSYEKVFINSTNESDWDSSGGGWDFLTWMSILDEKLEEQKQEELKAQKRRELLDRLTDEEKELLGVK